MSNTPFLFVPTFSWPEAPFGLLYTYIAGSTTPKTTYSDAAGLNPLTNPVELDATGSATIRLGSGSYKFVLLDQTNTVTIWTQDDYDSSQIDEVTQAFLGPIIYPQTTAEVSASVTPVNYIYPPGAVDRYGTNTTPLTTDMSAAFNAAVAQCMFGGRKVTYGYSGQYLLTSPVNCTFGSTANQFGLIVENIAATTNDSPNLGIIANHNGSAVFDCTGNDSVSFNNVSIGTTSQSPKTGILTARNSNKGSLFFKATNCKIIGSFSVAPYYNYGSEDDVLISCYFGNTSLAAGTKTRVYTGANISSVTSAFATDCLGNAVAIASGNISCVEHNDFGCLDYNQGGTSTSDCIYFDITDSFKKFGGWAYSASATSNGRALIYVDLTNGASNFADINGLTGEYVGVGIATLGSLVGGSGYSNGTYTGVALTGGQGSGSLATIVVAGNAVTSVTLTSPGDRYLVGDVLSASTAIIGAGTLFTISVATVSGARQLYGIAFSNNSQTPSGWSIEDTKLPNIKGAVAALGSLTIIDQLHTGGITEQSGFGISIPGTLQNSVLDFIGSITIGTSLRNRLTGFSNDWTITTRTNDYWIDTSTAGKSFSPGIANAAHGWTTGSVVQSGTYLLSGSTATFEISVQSAGNIACTTGATIPTLPNTASTPGVGVVIDATTRAMIGGCYISGNTVTMPAVTTTTDTVVITGTYFVA